MQWFPEAGRRQRFAIVLLMAPVLAIGCATLPDARAIDRQAQAAPAPEAVTRAQPTTAELRAAVGGGGDLQFIQDVTQIEGAVARRPLLGGNRVALLKDGPATHAAQLEAIRAAKHHVHLNIYLLTDDDVGQRYAEALSGRATAGVQVRVITDGLGGLGAGPEFRERLKQAGVEMREFNSVNPLKDPRLWRVTRRNHRKILVVDGQLAFTGGINITDDYSTGSKLSGSSGSNSSRGWRDTQIRVEGPAVAEFQLQFLRFWNELGDAAADQPQFYPQPTPRGDQFVRVVVDQGQDLLGNLLAPANAVVKSLSGSQKHDARIYATYLSAIQKSRQRVWITQAYFAPNDEFVATLVAAAARGVDVRLLMPGETDVGLLMHAARSHYQRLLDAGIRPYEYQDTVLHAKTAVIDGVWSTVGSANLDYRSFILNDEANAIVIGRDFGRQMERMFEDDLKAAREIRPEDWKRRSWWQRLKENGAAAIKFLL